MNKESRACDNKPSASWEATQDLYFTDIFFLKRRRKKRVLDYF
jgi:hypothetical protein